MLYSPNSKSIKNDLSKYDKSKEIVFISQASINMCWARKLCQYVIEKGLVPVNYFTVYSNFVHELASLQTMIDCINTLIVRCDYLWVFGEISEGMWHEIKMCKELGIPVRYFSIEKLPEEINEITEDKAIYTPKFEKKMKEDLSFYPVNASK